MKYVKINLSIGDKLKLLFFGLISEDKLPEKEVVRIVQVENITQTPVSTPVEDINNSEEEEFHVPFFELNDDDVKTNL